MAKGYVHGVVHILDWGPDKGLFAIVLDPQAAAVEGYFLAVKNWPNIGMHWMNLKGYSIDG